MGRLAEDFFSLAHKFPLLSSEQEREIGNRIQRSRTSEQEFFDRKISLEEYERMRQDELEARSLLIHSNIAFVIKKAKEFAHYSNIPIEDFASEGVLGLISAVEGFDPKYNTRFITFAAPRIVSSMIWLKRRHNHVSVPAYMFDAISQVLNADQQLKDLGERYEEKNVSEITHFSLKKIKSVRSTIDTLASEEITDQRNNKGEFFPITEVLEDSSSAEYLEQVQNEEMINFALNRLLEREAKILRMRLGMDRREPMTLVEVASVIGVSKERIRQIEVVAKNKIMEIVKDMYNTQ